MAGSSDFAFTWQARQSHQAESSSCRDPCGPLFYGLFVHVQLLSTPCRHDAVTFSHRRLAPPGRDSHPSVRVHSQAHQEAIQLYLRQQP